VAVVFGCRDNIRRLTKSPHSPVKTSREAIGIFIDWIKRLQQGLADGGAGPDRYLIAKFNSTLGLS
jgi:hypothetical protein